MSQKTNNAKWLVIIIVFLVVIFIVIPAVLVFNFKRWEINGPSMDPNYITGQYVFATNSDKNPTIGSVVIFKFPDPMVSNEKYGIKRIVAVAGDRVEISGNKLSVYDSQHPEGYNPTSGTVASNLGTPGNVNLVVPKGHVYILGDNRPDSLDSRNFGPIPDSDIVGKVLVKT